MMPTVSGVNLIGKFTDVSGLSEAARSTIRALEAVRIDFTLNDVGNVPVAADNVYPTGNPFPSNIVHLNPDHIWESRRFDLSLMRDRYNVGVWLWESLVFPREWYPAFDYFDEIWTPSAFCLEAISRVSPSPVVRMPLSIALETPTLTRTHFALPDDQFIFLFIFDLRSSFQRKDPLATIEAFKKAFGSQVDGPLLLLKSSNGAADKTAFERIKHAVNGAPNIRLIDRTMTREEIAALIYTCDCYVSLHRAEGFGLTMAEAMYFEKPVIATAYSANMEFMNADNSFPVRYELRPMIEDADYDLYKGGGEWAHASTDHASELMRKVLAEPEQTRQVGIQAGKDIRRQFAPPVIGAMIGDRLERIYNIIATSDDAPAELETQLAMERTHVDSQRKLIASMQESSFWRMREKWFRLKRKLGLAPEE